MIKIVDLFKKRTLKVIQTHHTCIIPIFIQIWLVPCCLLKIINIAKNSTTTKTLFTFHCIASSAALKFFILSYLSSCWFTCGLLGSGHCGGCWVFLLLLYCCCCLWMNQMVCSKYSLSAHNSRTYVQSTASFEVQSFVYIRTVPSWRWGIGSLDWSKHS